MDLSAALGSLMALSLSAQVGRRTRGRTSPLPALAASQGSFGSDALRPTPPSHSGPSVPDFLLIRVYQPGLIPSPESLAKFYLALCPLFSSPYSRSQLGPICRHSHRPGPGTLPTYGSKASPLLLRSSFVLMPSSDKSVYYLSQRLRPKDSKPLHAKHKLES